jgi:L-iditol 2-dehydrogenase
MRAVQVVAPGRAIFVEAPKPELKPGHALVRTKYLSLCGSDTHALYHSPPEAYPLPPGASGHEMVGAIEALDGADAPIQVGDLALTLVQNNQGMAEYFSAPVEHILVLPAGKPLDHLLQAQQLGTVIYAAKRLPNLVDKDVAVIGQGSAGLWWNFMLRRMGARRVIGVDLQAHRLALSKRYGATHTIHNAEAGAVQAIADITQGKMADVVVEAAGESDSINLAIDLVKRYGFLLYFGVPRVGKTMPFQMFDFFRKCVQCQTIVGAMADPGQSCTWMALELIASGVADPGPMITHHFPFDQVLEAYELQRTRDEGAVKIVIDMPG